MTEHALSPGPTVRFGRLEQRPLLLGLSGAQTACVGLSLTLAVAGLYLAGGAGFAAALPLSGPLAAAGLLRRDGRPFVAWLPVAGHWALRRAASQTRYLTRPRPSAPVSALALPGDAARLRLLTGPATGAALVHDPHAGTLTAVLQLTPPPFLLTDGPAQQRLVDGYGRLLATLSGRPGLTRIQVLERAVTEPGHELRAWWQRNGVEIGSWAARILTDLVADAAETCERHETYLAVSFDTRHHRAGRRIVGGALAGAVDTLENEMRTLAGAAAAADLTPGSWLHPGALARVVRTAYDPGQLPVDNTAAAATTATAASWGLAAGPTCLVETWDRLRSDSAHHAVYWIAEWPRAEVTAAFLQPLILMPGVRRALTITAEPLPVTRALRDIRRAKVEHAADTAQRARLGQVHDEAAAGEADDVIRRERELAGGHSDLRFAGLLAVSAPTEHELTDACGRLEQAAAQAQCDLRRLYGQQAQGFAAAALPLARGL